MSIPPDGRSPMAIALEWSSRIMAVSLEMVLPGLFGLWLDRQMGTLPWLMLVGLSVGGTLSMWHLLRMTNRSDTGVSSNEQGPQEKRDA